MNERFVECEECGNPLGTDPDCDDCTDAAEQMSRSDASRTADEAEAFLADPPWYAKFAPSNLWKRTKLLGRMVRDYFSGDYEEVPWGVVASAAAAVAYVVCPVDLIPDVLVPLGLTDDAAVVALVVGSLNDELSRYARVTGISREEAGL